MKAVYLSHTSIKIDCDFYHDGDFTVDIVISDMKDVMHHIWSNLLMNIKNKND